MPSLFVMCIMKPLFGPQQILFIHSDSEKNSLIKNMFYFVCFIFGLQLSVFNTTFNNITIFFNLVWSVLLVEETGVPVENQRSATGHWQTLPHQVVW